MSKLKIYIPVFSLLISVIFITGWGFFAHKNINQLAIFTLPSEQMAFYKKHIQYITEAAVNADKRRHAIKDEAARHYIDLDMYTDTLPLYWHQAKEKFPTDTLLKHGILPWHIYLMKQKLTKAFKEQNTKDILRYSADIGHYIADAHVPLHTTRNYNGQLTNQHGIHGFWESRLPELFFSEYDFFVGKASYIEEPQKTAWAIVYESNACVDSVLSLEKSLSESFPAHKKYSFEERGNRTVKVYSKEYSKAYHKLLNGMVERRMRASVKTIGDFWYTCWVDAGQPALMETEILEETINENILTTEHEDCIH